MRPCPPLVSMDSSGLFSVCPWTRLRSAASGAVVPVLVYRPGLRTDVPVHTSHPSAGGWRALSPGIASACRLPSGVLGAALQAPGLGRGMQASRTASRREPGGVGLGGQCHQEGQPAGSGPLHGRSDSPFGCRPPRGRVEAQALPSSLRICARPSEGPGGGAGRRRDRRLGLGSQPRHERCPRCRLPLHAGGMAGGWGRARSAQRQTGWPCLPESHFPSASWRWAAAAPLAGREVTHGRHAVTPVSRRQP